MVSPKVNFPDNFEIKDIKMGKPIDKIVKEGITPGENEREAKTNCIDALLPVRQKGQLLVAKVNEKENTV